ncbi:hypothetical protein [Amycolatopsis sp. cmx-11-51]|uniref:hypothetical protein n=1 Tax=Amycolatopsis sp. cmx-11-51 TaxID=2785797 RepID=UPI0039E48570
MNPPLAANDLRAALESLDHVFEAFAEEMDGEPTLGEFLEILSMSVQPGDSTLADASFPLLMKAKKKDDSWYKAEPSDRVASLNDNTFSVASAFLTLLIDRSCAGSPQTMSTENLASRILEVLEASNRPFADIAGREHSGFVLNLRRRTHSRRSATSSRSPRSREGITWRLHSGLTPWALPSGYWQASPLDRRSATSVPSRSTHSDLHWP